MTRQKKYAKEIADCLARFEGRDYSPDGPVVWAWHVHHKRLCEPLTEPIAERVNYIVEHKPEAEIVKRLCWLSPVKSELPPEFLAAYVKWRTADGKLSAAYAEWRFAIRGVFQDRTAKGSAASKLRAACEKWRALEVELQAARAEYLVVDAKLSAAFAECAAEVEALHVQEHPGCPWNGETLLLEELVGRSKLCV